MPFTIDETIEIDAAPDVVWKVITDFDRYSEWNPFVVECSSSCQVGDPIAMRVRIFGRFAQPQTETVSEFAAGKRFGYGVAAMRLGAMASNRTHEVEAIEGGQTRYRSHFELNGWLARPVRGLLGRRLERGFRAMTHALGQRAEALAAQAKTPTTRAPE